MSIFDAIILGIVEGLTEFIPISSTAHLAMTAKILGLAQTDFVKTFEIAIQLGAILAVVIMFWNTLATQKNLTKKVIAAFIPTGIIGFLLYKVIKDVFLESYPIMVGSLIIGGIIIIFFEKFQATRPSQKPIESLTYYDAMKIGTFQALSIIPGVSRAGATIVGGMVLGFERKAIVQFSFLLAIPTMLAATVFDIYKNAGSFSQTEVTPLLVGFSVAFVAALFAIRFFMTYISRHTFSIFGIYRIIIGILFFLVFVI